MCRLSLSKLSLFFGDFVPLKAICYYLVDGLQRSANSMYVICYVVSTLTPQGVVGGTMTVM